MILVSNYIKVKSRKQLRREIEKSQLKIDKAGSNDSQPGGVQNAGPIRNPTGVPMPGDHQASNIFWGEGLTTSQGGMGTGGVGAPTEQARSAITLSEAVYPYSITARQSVQYKVQELSDMANSRIEPGTNEQNPLASENAGSVVNAVERTTGLDKDRIERAKESKLEWIRKSIRGK